MYFMKISFYFLADRDGFVARHTQGTDFVKYENTCILHFTLTSEVTSHETKAFAVYVTFAFSQVNTGNAKTCLQRTELVLL